ncbi:hypothetical protein MNEG_13142, partial [Monoraphidium neglectum]
ALQLATLLAALNLAPAVLGPGGNSPPCVRLVFATCFVFIAGGSVRRVPRYGPLAPAHHDMQPALRRRAGRIITGLYSHYARRPLPAAAAPPDRDSGAAAAA